MQALLSRYPRLAETVPRVDLGVCETPVERWTVGDTPLLAKRDDLSAPSLGGNKVRALELLFAGMHPGDTLLTVGAAGSSHALAVAEHGARIGARTTVLTWPQETHAVARRTAERLAESADVIRARSVAEAYLRAMLYRVRGGVHWIPAGGSAPLGALGHVSAALEMAEQTSHRGTGPPDVVVVPLGTGGTASGLLVGLAIARLPTRVVGVRVVPRIIANHVRVARLARRTHALLAERAATTLPPLDTHRLIIDERAYGGAYGRETADGRRAADELRMAGGPLVEATYSAKALAVALARARSAPDERVLFWLTFDARWLAPDSSGAVPRHGTHSAP